MKIRYEFSDTSIRKDDLHPDALFQREQIMAADFVRRSIFNKEHRLCPVCGKEMTEVLFTKWDVVTYGLCTEDWTVSLVSAPSDERISEYFFRSELALFRASLDYQRQVALLRQNMWRNLIDWIEGRASRYLGDDKYTVLDWGSGVSGWLEALKSSLFVKNLQVTKTLPPINGASSEKVQAKIVCLIDCLQRELSPSLLIKEVYNRVAPGGLLLIACRAGSGFDILTLRESSQTVFPFDHIFLPSPMGISRLLKDAGFEILEITTPGMMDVSYVKSDKGSIPREQYFQRYLMATADDHMLERLQGFLQRNNLSSHLRCVARKPISSEETL